MTGSIQNFYPDSPQGYVAPNGLYVAPPPPQGYVAPNGLYVAPPPPQWYVAPNGLYVAPPPPQGYVAPDGLYAAPPPPQGYVAPNGDPNNCYSSQQQRMDTDRRVNNFYNQRRNTQDQMLQNTQYNMDQEIPHHTERVLGSESHVFQGPVQTSFQVPVHSYYAQPDIANFPIVQFPQTVSSERVVEPSDPVRDPSPPPRPKLNPLGLYPKTESLSHGGRTEFGVHIQEGIRGIRGKEHEFSLEAIKTAVENEAVYKKILESKESRAFLYFIPEELHGQRDSFLVLVGAKVSDNKVYIITTYDFPKAEYRSQLDSLKQRKNLFYVVGQDEVIKYDADSDKKPENSEEAARMLQQLAKYK